MLCSLQDAVRALLPGQVEAQPELLDQLGSMVSPQALKRHGVTVYGVTQVRAWSAAAVGCVAKVNLLMGQAVGLCAHTCASGALPHWTMDF